MPFESQAQARFAFATNQPWAKEWADKTDFTKLPRKVRAKVRNYRRTIGSVANKEVPSAIPSPGNASGPGGLFSAAGLEKGRIRKKSGMEGHTSAMIALYLPALLASDLAAQGRSIFGDSAEKADDLHITLAYLGKVDALEDKIPYLMAAVQGYALNYCQLYNRPISAIIEGIEFFPTKQNDGSYPVYFGVQSEELRTFVKGLDEVLSIVGVPVDRSVGDGQFNPHVTIAYRQPDQVPHFAIESRTALFDTITVALGDLHIDMPLSPPIATFKAKPTESAPTAAQTPVTTPKPPGVSGGGGKGTPGEQLEPGVVRIRGNLCQVHGKFGPCDSASSEGFGKKPKKARGGKGGGKGKKAPKTPDERKAERDQRRAEAQQEKQAQTAQNRADSLAALPNRPNDDAMAAMDSLRAGGTAPSGILEGLEKEGLVEKHADGTYTLSASGHKFQNALDKGDGGAANEAIAGGHDAVKHRADAEAAKQQRLADQQQRKQDFEDRRKQREADRKKREADRKQRASGGKGKGPKNQSPDAEALQKKLDILQGNFEKLLKLRTTAQKSKEDAPNYEPAASPGTSCSTCEHFQLHTCTLYDFQAEPSWTCDSWHSRHLTEVLTPLNNPPGVGLKALDDDSGLMAFKQADGQWRWVLYSSDAFEDRDGEVVTRKALENDVARTDKDGDYGPLRWWHVGSPRWKDPMDWKSVVPGPGLDIGTTDFSAMSGPVLIESGLFNSPEIGAAVARKSADLQSSLGFSHPLAEPDVDGLYHHIRRFERSLTPRLKASNPRTHAIVVKEAQPVQDEKKLAAFKALVGDEVAETALNQASVSTKEARQAGIREKAQEPGNGPETLESIQAQIAALSGQIASFKSKEEPVTNAKAAGTPPVQEPSTIAEKDDGEEPDGDEGMGEGDGDGDEMYIGDMTAPEFTAVLQQALAPLFEGVNKSFDLHTKIGDVHKAMGEMKQYLGGLTQKDSSNAELEETRQTLQQAMITMKAMKEQLDATAQELQDLQGTMPRAATRPQGTAYKASEAVDNTIPPGSPIFQAPIGAEQGSQVQMSPLSWIDQFVVAQQSAPAQAGVQPAVVIPQQ